MKTTNGVVAFAWSVPEATNASIACMASLKARAIDAPVYTQRLVSIESGIDVEYISEKPGKWAPTLRIARAAVVWAGERGIDTLWVACAKPHLWRCKRDLQKAVSEAGAEIRICVCPEVHVSSWQEWFSKESVLLKARSASVWVVYDSILWLMPFFIYKRVAS